MPDEQNKTELGQLKLCLPDGENKTDVGQLSDTKQYACLSDGENKTDVGHTFSLRLAPQMSCIH